MAPSSTRPARTRAYAESGVSTSCSRVTHASPRRRFRLSAARATTVSQSHLLHDDRTCDYDRDTLGRLAFRLADHRACNREKRRGATWTFATRSLALYVDRAPITLFSPVGSARSDARPLKYG